MYVIVSDNVFPSGKLYYLGWQPSYYTDGWTWTSKECWFELLRFNGCPHRFAFSRIEDAWQAIRDLNLRTGYVIKLEEES